MSSDPGRVSKLGTFHHAAEQATGRDIATRAQELKLVFLGLTRALPFLMHPAVPLLQWHLKELGVEPDGELPIERRHALEEKVLVYSASDALTKLTMLEGEVVGRHLMSISMMHGATRLGDMIDLGGHRQSVDSVI